MEGEFPLLLCEAPVMVEKAFEPQMMSKLTHIKVIKVWSSYMGYGDIS